MPGGKVKRYGYAFIYISMECPVCQSLFKTEKIRMQIGGNVRMPLYVVDVAMLPMSEVVKLWGWRLTEHGLVLRVTVPFLVVYCDDGRVVWKGEIRPLNGHEFTGPDIKKIISIINSAQIHCHVSESPGDTSGPGEGGQEEKPKRRRKKGGEEGV